MADVEVEQALRSETQSTPTSADVAAAVAKFRFTPAKFIEALPGDKVEDDSSPRLVKQAFWSKCPTKKSKEPLVTVAWSDECAKSLGVTDVSEDEKQALAPYLCGNTMFPNTTPYAQAYCGFQFGVFAGQLGDGRAISIGDVTSPSGERWELQWKGAGPTPFGRGFDGRAVLRSSVREFLCSEAMHSLGVPTTRALSLVKTNTMVVRESPEAGAVVVRVAPSWVRFGTFEQQFYLKQFPNVKLLADYVISNHFKELEESEFKYQAFLRAVMNRTARLMALWQAVGFCHGVMNTDNFSILGLTLDYGPFGFLDAFQSDHVCNHSDSSGRYSYDNQPTIGKWNLDKLARALQPVIDTDDSDKIIMEYDEVYSNYLCQTMRSKLGLFEALESNKEFLVLLTQMLEQVQEISLDYTVFFRGLSLISANGLASAQDPAILKLLEDAGAKEVQGDSSETAILLAWFDKYKARLARETLPDADRKAKMNLSNPKYILRNYMCQNAIDKAEAGDYSEVRRLYELLKRPYDEQPEMHKYSQRSPEWAKQLVIGCSS